MKNISYTILVISLQIFWGSITQAQVVNSVYSMFGMGQLVDNNYGINRSLGGTGIALKSGRSMNNLNPASYIGIKPRSYVLEAGVYGLVNKSENSSYDQTGSSINFGYFSASLYCTDWWATTFGIAPYSSIDYTIVSNNHITGTPLSIEKKYTGTGGLSRLFWGNSVRIYEGLTMGINTSYILGPITQTESAESNGTFGGYTLENKRNAYSLYVDYGIQYSFTYNETEYTLGIIYGANQKLHTSDELQFTYGGTTTELDQDDQAPIKIPQKFGVGIAMRNGNSFRAGIDYEWNNWSKVEFSNVTINSMNSNRFSLGIEYTPWDGNSKSSIINKLYYRFGANYKESYLELDKNRINSFGVNVGIGFPYDNSTIFNMTLEYGQEGTISDGLIKNSYWMLYLNFSIHEFWANNLRL